MIYMIYFNNLCRKPIAKKGGILYFQNKHSLSSSQNFLQQLLSLHDYLSSRHKNLSLLTQHQKLSMHCFVVSVSCIHITYNNWKTKFFAELAYNVRANEKWDVYSFRDVALEVITGKYPGVLISSLSSSPPDHQILLKDVLDHSSHLQCIK